MGRTVIERGGENMTVLEFLDSKGWKYTVKGKEAHLEYCPYCHAKNRFNVNIETGAYICNRQSSCGAKGTFKLDKSVVKSNNVAKVKLGIEQFDTLDNKMLDYMQNRGISKETLKKARVLKSKKNGAFCFFYTDITGKAVGVKYRTIDKKIWSEEGSDMLLLNWDKISDKTETLIITEGEIDMLSLMQVGFDNVVSVPNGSSNMEWIEKHYTWLEKFKTIILCYDNDEAGKKALKQSSERLSELNCELKTIDLLFYKDPNEILQDDGGAEKLKNIFSNNIKDVMQDNIIYASETLIEDDIKAIDWQDRGFNQLTGGCRYGEVMIITANSGAGKSTFANNMIANLLNQGYSIYTHQGEFRPGKFKANLYKIMCRPAQIETYRNEFKNKIYGKISQITENKINDWLGDRLIIHGSQTPSKEELLRTMELVYKRHGVRFMFIDNLMTIAIDGQDKYEEQKQLLIQLQAFAKKYNVFICVVAHPKKNNASLEDVDQYVVSGASEIVNLANFVLYLKRLSDDEKEKLAELGIEASIGGVALKDREFGDLNKKEYWNYEIKTGRFLDTVNQNKSLEKTYNWENYEQIKKELDIEYPFQEEIMKIEKFLEKISQDERVDKIRHDKKMGYELILKDGYCVLNTTYRSQWI